MKILWIEDQPERKIDQFDPFLRSRNKEIPLDSSIESKIQLLQSFGVVIIKDFSVFIDILTSTNWRERLTTFFNGFDLVFCDVNLTDNPRILPDDEVYAEIIKNTKIHFTRHYEGEGIFEALLVLKSEIETQRIANKFYFFSAYDGLTNVKEKLEQLYCDRFRQLEWARIHCIENRSDVSSNEFHPYKFKDNKYAKIFGKKESWLENGPCMFQMEDSEELSDVFAEIRTDGKWCISFNFSKLGNKVSLLEGEDFLVERNSIITTQERIIKAIDGIVLGIVEALYNAYYKIRFLESEKSTLDKVFINYYRLCSDTNYTLDDIEWAGLFTFLRKLFESSRKATQDIVFPDNSFEECMRKKEFDFWSKETNNIDIDITIEKPYPEEYINQQPNIPYKWKRWIAFHKKWSMNIGKEWLPIYASCPEYINNTIKWAFNDLLSAYDSHAPQAKYERQNLSKDLLPSQNHEFKALVEALLLVLDFIIKIDGNTLLLDKMRQFIPYKP